MTREVFNTLPPDIQAQILSTLRCYNSVHVTFGYGRYEASTGVALLGKYPPDFKVIGDAHAEDFYTEDEQIQNYVESFGDFPPQYKGKRDWLTLRDWYDHKREAADRSGYSVRIEDGNVVFSYPAPPPPPAETSYYRKLWACLKLSIQKNTCHSNEIVVALGKLIESDYKHSDPTMEVWCDYFLKRNTQ